MHALLPEVPFDVIPEADQRAFLTDLLAALREGRVALGEEPEGACDDLTEDAAEAEDAQSAPAKSSAGRGAEGKDHGLEVAQGTP